MDNVEILIGAIRATCPDAIHKYKHGACFHLFVTLALAYPEAECWYDQIEGHAYTKLGGAFYDIRGKVWPENHETMIRIQDEPRIYDEAFNWVKNLL